MKKENKKEKETARTTKERKVTSLQEPLKEGNGDTP
jgi:hypothetical protein